MKTRIAAVLLLFLATLAYAEVSSNTVLPWFYTNGNQGVKGLYWTNEGNTFRGFRGNIATGFFGKAYGSDTITDDTQLVTKAYVTNLLVSSYVTTNEARQVVLTNAQNVLRAVPGTVSNDVVIRSQLDALQAVTVYGTTNAHPYFSTNGGLYAFESALPATQWTNVYEVPTNGTYFVGARIETGTVTQIAAGDYVLHVWSEVNAAITEGYYYSVLGSYNTATQFTAVATGAYIYASTERHSDPSTIHLATNIAFTGVVYRAVQRYFVRTSGNAGSTFRIFGGDGTDTRMVRGVTVAEQTDATTLRGYAPDDFFNAANQTNKTADVRVMSWALICPTNAGLGWSLQPFPGAASTCTAVIVDNGAQTNVINAWRKDAAASSTPVQVLTNLMCAVGITTNAGRFVVTNNQAILFDVSGMTGGIIQTNHVSINARMEAVP